MRFSKFWAMLFVACYAIFMLLMVISCFRLSRRVVIEDRELHGYVIINGTKYTVPFRSQKTAVSLPVTNPVAFLLVSTTEQDECFVTALLKLSICILLLIFLWNFDFSDPFNIRNLKLPLIIGRLAIALIITDLIKAWYTSDWVTGLGDFKYQVTYSSAAYMTAFFIIALFATWYIKAVNNRRELELTI
jgi:hypothetical protein